MYLALKHLHIACAILAGIGMFLRGLWMMTGSGLLQHRWVKVVPHINDTVLLGAAIALAVLTGQYPFVHGWLTAKLFGVIAYIALGAVALRPGRPRAVRVAAWSGALATLAYIASAALTKSAWGPLIPAPGG